MENPVDFPLNQSIELTNVNPGLINPKQLLNWRYHFLVSNDHWGVPPASRISVDGRAAMDVMDVRRGEPDPKAAEWAASRRLEGTHHLEIE